MVSTLSLKGNSAWRWRLQLGIVGQPQPQPGHGLCDFRAEERLQFNLAAFRRRVRVAVDFVRLPPEMLQQIAQVGLIQPIRVQQPIDTLGNDKALFPCVLHVPLVEQLERGRGKEIGQPAATEAQVTRYLFIGQPQMLDANPPRRIQKDVEDSWVHVHVEVAIYMRTGQVGGKECFKLSFDFAPQLPLGSR